MLRTKPCSRRLGRLTACLTIALLGGCPEAGEPTLDFTASPAKIKGDGKATAGLNIEAKEANGSPGTGFVLITADRGALPPNGDPQGTFELIRGWASAKYSCNTTADPGCAGPQTLTASWRSLSASINVQVEGVAVPLDAGHPDAESAAGPDASGPDTGSEPADAGLGFDGSRPFDAATNDAALGADAGGEDGGTSADVGRGDSGLQLPPFDPNGMYMMSSVYDHWNDYEGIICNIQTPDIAAGGFYGAPYWDIQGASFRRSDGRLIYVSTSGPNTRRELRGFTVDFIASTNYPWVYAGEPWANDLLLPTPACDANPYGVGLFLINPQSSEAWYTCDHGDGTYYSSAGNAISACTMGDYPAPALQSLGEDGSRLCTHSVFDAVGTERALSQELSWVLTRPKPGGGFWAIVDRSTSNPYVFQVERWSIEPSGTVSLDGTYSSCPSGFMFVSRRESQGIDRLGRYYRLVKTLDNSGHGIARFEADFSSSSLVHDGTTYPVCQTGVNAGSWWNHFFVTAL
ncbi:MAG: hypothetical protein HY901_27370 [Deltaproteobacteria bacterium]|nr:hypothetical protein [Deltaproteobacteria bacterium]